MAGTEGLYKPSMSKGTRGEKIGKKEGGKTGVKNCQLIYSIKTDHSGRSWRRLKRGEKNKVGVERGGGGARPVRNDNEQREEGPIVKGWKAERQQGETR